MTLATETRAEHYVLRPREVRATVTQVALGDADGDTVVISGYASVTGAPYLVRDWLGEYEETVARGAFGKTLHEQDDARWLINHEGVPLARTKSGTLDLVEIVDPADDPRGNGTTGLWTVARMDSASPLVQTIRSAIERGDMSDMSFAFQATRQEWNEDYSVRTIREVKLFDVSGVTYPANPAADDLQVDSARAAAEPDTAIEDEARVAELNRRRLAKARAAAGH